MKKIAILGVITLFLVGCKSKPVVTNLPDTQISSQSSLNVQQNTGQVSINPIPNPNIGVIKQKSLQEALVEVKDEYKKSPTFNACMVNNLRNCVDSEIQNQAMSGNDIKICEKLSDENVRLACKESLLSSEALKKKNFQLCNQIANPLNCVSMVAKQLAIETKDINQCDIIKQYDKQYGSGDNNTKTFVPRRDGKLLFSNCRNEVIFFLATSSNKKEYCSKITEEFTKKTCLNFFNASKVNTPNPNSNP